MLHTLTSIIRMRPNTSLLIAGPALVGMAALAALVPGAGTADAAAPFNIPACGGASPASPAVARSIPIGDLAVPAPAITAQAAVAIDAETGRVLYGLNEHERRAPASTTKIMTAILGVEQGTPDQHVVAQVDASTMYGSSVMGLRPGTDIDLNNLLYGLMLPSGNDAALEIAKAVSGDVPPFIDRMNAKAEELGLRDTHFMNPHGLDEREHFSSAYDLALMGRYGMQNPEFRRIVGSVSHDLPSPLDYTLTNGNSLLGTYPGADGVKIGWTDEAGWTFVASAERDGRRVIVALLNTENRDADAATLFDWAWASTRWSDVNPATMPAFKLAQRLGFGDSLMRAFSVCA